MDKLKDYGKVIANILNRHAEMINRSGKNDVETTAIIDDTRNHYMLFRIGWRHKERVHTAILYLRIRNGKIWIEEDWTENGIATELLEMGVPHQDIVLAFHHPSMRPMTQFAAA
ncbi:MAG: XisI protein [Desulfobacteraceae bacterium]|nr:XisI protein [Desulfobacteraceae bacterium]